MPRQRSLALLTNDEITALQECETVIAKGRESFMGVGLALTRIRNERLYRQTHKTFEGYCKEKWEFGKAYAYYLIGSVKVIENVHPGGQNGAPITNEKQARELGKAPADKQAEAWEEATKDKPNPSAKEVKEAVKKVAKPKVDPKDPPLSKGTQNALDQVSVFKDILSRVRKLKADLVELADTKIGKFLTIQPVESNLKNVEQYIKDATPHGPCPVCAQKGCKACLGLGWISEGVLKRLPKS